MEPTLDPSLAHLRARLAVVEARVGATVALRRRTRADEDERFRGLYLSEADVDRLLSGQAGGPLVELDGDSATFLEKVEVAVAESGDTTRLAALRNRFAMDDVDIELLLIALAPDVDARFEKLYAWLHDDVSRRRPTIGLVLEIAGRHHDDASARARLRPGSPLVEHGLVEVLDPEMPFLSRRLRVPDRVTGHLLGDETPDDVVAGLAAATAPIRLDDIEPLTRALVNGTLLSYVRGEASMPTRALAVAAAEQAGWPVLSIDFRRLPPPGSERSVAIAVSREAGLRGALVVGGPVESLAERGTDAVRAFAERPWPAVLLGTAGWDPRWSVRVPYLVDAAPATATQRQATWEHAVASVGEVDGDVAAATAAFRLAPEDVLRAAIHAQVSAVAHDRPPTSGDLVEGARAQNSAGLERLARRLVPRVAWDDLILPKVPSQQLQELAAHARHREQVLDEWQMGSGSRRRGIIALFAGPPGTGKTMAAEVVAGALGLELYVINLATVVDKYIGETEKNLERIFAEAQGVNCVLFFDEADAIFGKRSEVKDARDRYANVEVAYLLQRLERFDGTAILATNLRANVDEAFARRLDVAVDFPFPDEAQRLSLWRAGFRDEVPLADDIDWDFLAGSFELAGGNITNIATTAAFLAAEDGTPVDMTDMVRATEREYRKLGRLCVRSEFGPYYERLDSPA